MFKKSLVALLLILSFTLVWAEPTDPDYSKYTFPAVTSALEVAFEEIRVYAKSFKILPFTDEKGAQLTKDVADIIIKHGFNEKYLLKKDPIIGLLVAPSLVNPTERMYYLQIMLSLYENDQMVLGNQCLVTL